MYAFLPCTSVADLQLSDSALFRHAVFLPWFPAEVSAPSPQGWQRVSLMEVGKIESIPKLLLFSYLLYILYERTHLEIDIKRSYQDNYGCDCLHKIGNRGLV